MSGGHLVTRVTIEQARKIRLRKKEKSEHRTVGVSRSVELKR